ncbi:ATP-dependent Clp protease ATP-binding subunit [bacterium]|nr:MAG: ATP-dependent Clp protease ATP-binding subunit [bacterium]
MFQFNLLDLFSDRAKEAIQNAAKYALDFRMPFIDTEHLLLGICSDDVVDRVLNDLGTSSEAIRNRIEPSLTPGNATNANQIEISPRAKQVLELAIQNARNLNHRYVGPEHILIGLLEENEGLAAQVLKSFGLNLPEVRNAVEKIVGAEELKKKEVSETPTIDKYSRDLTALAKAGKIDPVIGRSKEVTRVIQILSRRKKNNPVLIGDPGVGKTAIAEGLALRISSGNVPEVLLDKRVMALDLGMLVAGAKFRGEFEERAMKILQEVQRAKGKIILFIDELHTVVGAGDKEGGLDLSNIMKPPLARGELQMIGATTIDEYRKYIEKDGALERRFQPVQVDEPTIEETIAILRGIKDKYESHHKIEITDEAIVAAAEFAEKYIQDRFMPDKAIDLIDEAASKVRLEKMVKPEDLKKVEHEIGKMEQERESLTVSQKFEEAAALKLEIDEKQKEIEKLTQEWMKVRGTGTPKLTEDDIAEVCSMITKIPVSRLKLDEKLKLINLESDIHKRLIGQNEAVQAVASAIRRARAGLKSPSRPIASFLFLGPTGVGKTELAKSVAAEVFGSDENIIRIDMSEFSEKFTSSKLIGAPPGYVGYDEGGQLTEKVRRNPYSLILLDEIEKADNEIFNTLLQILEDGRLTDGKGRTVSFKNTIIIATSNLGSEIIQDYYKFGKVSNALGFKVNEDTDNIEAKKSKVTKNDNPKSTWDFVVQEVREDIDKFFKPEFINRLDGIIIFKPLAKDEVQQIVRLELDKVVKNLVSQHFDMKYDEKVIEQLLEDGFSEEFGAREIRRVIQREVEDKIAEGILQDENDFEVKVGKGKLKIKKI